MSNLIHFKVGFADHRAHPDGITGLPASLGTVCQSSIFVNRWGIEPRPLWGLALSCDLPFSCPCAGLALPAIIPIFAEPN